VADPPCRSSISDDDDESIVPHRLADTMEFNECCKKCMPRTVILINPSIDPLFLPPHFFLFDRRSDSIDAKRVADVS
jgi:hypothetical protein